MYKCPRCGTEYFHGPAECDWCPEVQTYEMPRVFVRRAVAAAAVGMLLGLAACGVYDNWPGDEVRAKAECALHDGLAHYDTTSFFRENGGWYPGFAYHLNVTCRDGSQHVIAVKKTS